MKLRKLLMLAVILGSGMLVEGAWHLRSSGFTRAACRVWRGRFHGPSFTFEARQSLPISDLAEIEVTNALGSVRVRPGAPGVAELHLRKVVFLPTEAEARAFADRIALDAQQSGPRLLISTNRAALERGEPECADFETHLDLVFPPGSVLKVRNRHGAVDVSGLQAVDLETSAGELRASEISGPARLVGRSGAVRVLKIGGPLTLSSRRGEVEVADVAAGGVLEVSQGDARVSRTGPLKITLKQGKLEAADIRGDVDVHGEHARLAIAGVTGSAVVENAFGRISLERISGSVRIKGSHGAIVVRDAAGALNAEARFGDVELTRVSGPVKAQVEHGGLRGERLLGGTQVKALGDDVILTDCTGPIEVEVRRGKAELKPGQPVRAPITVMTELGDLTLHVPAGSRFSLDADASRGEVTTPLRGFAVRERVGQRVVGDLAGGGPQVRLVARHGDIRVVDSP